VIGVAVMRVAVMTDIVAAKSMRIGASANIVSAAKIAMRVAHANERHGKLAHKDGSAENGADQKDGVHRLYP
jgi:hypothetical protein